MLEVYRHKVEVIEKFLPPIKVKGVVSFLEHDGFYGRFIKDFSKTGRLMSILLDKEMMFLFVEKCLHEFELLKKKLIEPPNLINPNEDLSFELMCGANDIAVRLVLGQRKYKMF